MRKPIIVANWKMHGRKKVVNEFFPELLGLIGMDSSVDVTVCPPFLYLSAANAANTGGVVTVGVQNVAEYGENGAYTGECSAAMAAEFDCQYAIIGHSERRAYFREQSASIAKKFLAAKQVGITPIFCVGETLEQHQKGDVEQVIRTQIEEVISIVGTQNFKNCVVAYEPIWAIGTGESAEPKQIEEIHAMIRQIFISDGVDAAVDLRIIYGGSVKPENAKTIFNKPNVDGALVGKASLNAADFYQIILAARQD